MHRPLVWMMQPVGRRRTKQKYQPPQSPKQFLREFISFTMIVPLVISINSTIELTNTTVHQSDIETNRVMWVLAFHFASAIVNAYYRSYVQVFPPWISVTYTIPVLLIHCWSAHTEAFQCSPGIYFVLLFVFLFQISPLEWPITPRLGVRVARKGLFVFLVSTVYTNHLISSESLLFFIL